MLTHRFSLLLALPLLFPIVGNAQDSSPTPTAELITLLDSLTPELLTERKVPGLAVAVIHQGGPIYQRGFGLADVATRREVSATTGFNVGSVSKMFTAWGVMKLVENGKIELDDPIEGHLTRWQLPVSAYDHDSVTVRAVLSHTAGLSVHGYPGFPPGYALPTLEESLNGENGPVRDNEAVAVVVPPQSVFRYSGGGYTLLQLMIEEVTGLSFADYMQREVFDPLGMQSTSFALNETTFAASATPYGPEGEEVPFERFTAQAAAGLQTNLTDLVTFAGAAFGENAVLAPATVRRMTEIIPLTRSKRQAYGLGYSTYFLGPVAVTGHTGSNTGWEAGFLMDFSDRSGIIILTNSSNGKGAAIRLLRTWAKWKGGGK